MEQQETWDQLYHRKRQEQRAARGAKVRYQRLRQEIADLAIDYVETARDCLDPPILDALYDQQEQKVKELRTLEQQYPSVKELT